MNDISAQKKKKSTALWVWGLLLLSFCLTVYIMPPAFIFDTAPIGFIDFMQHYSHADSFVELFKSSLSTWGYNPKYMAGFPDLTIFDIDNKFVEWFALLGSLVGIKTAVSLKIVIFLELFIEPFLLYFAFLNFKSGKKQALWACLGGIFILNGPAGLFFNAGGMFSFLFAAFLSTLVVSLYYRLLISEDYGLCPLTVLLTALAPIFHSTSVFMIGIPVLFLIILRLKKLSSSQLIWIGLSAAAAVLVNLYWIIPLLKNLKYSIANDYAWTGSFDMMQFAAFWIGGTILAMGGLCALLYFFKGYKILGKDRKELAILVIFMSVLLILAGGPGWPLVRSLQPNRFLILLQIYLLIPFIALLDQRFNVRSTAKKKLLAALLIISIIVPAGGMAFVRFADPGDSMILGIAHKLFGRRLEAGNIADPRTQSLIQWLNQNTSPEQGRIMLEHPQGEGSESPFMTFYTGLLPAVHHYINGEFIGAPRFEAPLIHSRNTRFSHDEMFGEKLADMDGTELAYKLNLYNVKWIVAVEGTATACLDRYPDILTRKKQIDSVSIYEVKAGISTGYFLKGTGNIKADINRLELTDLKGDDIIIKYHWNEGFKAPAGTTVQRFAVQGDDVGFIRLLNPPANMVLEF